MTRILDVLGLTSIACAVRRILQSAIITVASIVVLLSVLTGSGCLPESRTYEIVTNNQDRMLAMGMRYRQDQKLEYGTLIPSCTQTWIRNHYVVGDMATYTFRELREDMSRGEAFYTVTVKPSEVGIDRSTGFFEKGFLFEVSVPERWAGECSTIKVQNTLLFDVRTETPK